MENLMNAKMRKKEGGKFLRITKNIYRDTNHSLDLSIPISGKLSKSTFEIFPLKSLIRRRAPFKDFRIKNKRRKKNNK